MRKTSLFGIGFLLAGALSSVPVGARAPRLEMVRAANSSVPTFVTGIQDVVRAGGPERAARSFLASHPGLFRLDGSELRHLNTESRGRSTTVRFAQFHRGVPVWAAQYLVHLADAGDGHRVVSANGHVFSDLQVDVTPEIDAQAARLMGKLRVRPVVPQRVEAHGLEILPFGRGALTYHFTIWGTRFG
ncbi:MAG TPA: hypothetical protein VHJ82_08400, partial [Actinomycetota bacterium]|nr:hypothetical protein [Actinomycetota bacterium]